jgi:hypothetical protein
MFGLAEGCRRIAPVIIEDDDRIWDEILVTLERWGDLRVPRDSNWNHPMDRHYHRGIASI